MKVLKLQNGQEFNSMLPDSATRLKVCKQAFRITCRGNGATGRKPSCILRPTETFYHAAFLPFPPLIMILSFWAMFLITPWPKFGPVIDTELSEKNGKLKIPRNAAKDVASSGVFEWINSWQNYW